jgi:hypothetical protein
MITIKVIFFGMMLVWIPSLILLAHLLWREGLGRRTDRGDRLRLLFLSHGLEFEDQPPNPGAQHERRANNSRPHRCETTVSARGSKADLNLKLPLVTRIGPRSVVPNRLDRCHEELSAKSQRSLKLQLR